MSRPAPWPSACRPGLCATSKNETRSPRPAGRADPDPGLRWRAVGLASEATSLLLSFSLVQYLARLTAVAVALAGWVLWAWPSASPGGGVGVVLAVGALAPLVEVLAESVSLRSAERAACRLSLVGTAVVLVAAPVRWAHRRLARASDGRRAGVVPPLVTEEEIKTIVDAGEEGGAIEVEEKEMIFSIFELGETLVREVMVPRIDICAFEDTQML